MESQVFRKSSLDRMSSPEDLHDYMHISSPRLWMVLSIIMVLLVGFIVYASLVTMENTVSGKATSSIVEIEGQEPFYFIEMEIPRSFQQSVAKGMTVRFADREGVVEAIYDNNDGVFVLVDLEDPSVPLPDGEYDAEIVLEQITPISFLLN